MTQFGALSWLHSTGAFDVQTSFVARYSSLTFVPDFPGDLLFTGVAQNAFKQNMAYGAQSDAAYHLNENNIIRAGLFVQTDHAVSNTSSQVLLTDDTGVPLSDVPTTLIDNGSKTEWIYSAYLQDEWKLIPTVTLNYGLRFDRFTAYTSDNQTSPRVNVVWQLCPAPRCTRAIPATCPRRPSSWSAPRTLPCLQTRPTPPARRKPPRHWPRGPITTILACNRRSRRNLSSASIATTSNR